MQSTTVMTLLLRAIERVNIQPIFDRDSYESRRTALPGARLLKVLAAFQLIKSPRLRGLIQTIADHAALQRALGGTVARNTLSNALQQREWEAFEV